MSPELVWIVVAIAVVVAIVGGIWWSRQRRTKQLRTRFGPEYDRTVQHTGTRAKAEAALQERARRVERLHIRPLTAEDAARFSDAWRRVQTQFVDDPNAAVTGADRLLGEVMQARGYPVGDFEQRVEDISVDHPNVVVNYRAARDLARRHDRGQASTEDLRQAMVHYRSLFTELLEVTPAPRQEAHEPAGAHRGPA
jgi:FtsZ-interacting cell division protein ZipA